MRGATAAARGVLPTATGVGSDRPVRRIHLRGQHVVYSVVKLLDLSPKSHPHQRLALESSRMQIGLKQTV